MRGPGTVLGGRYALTERIGGGGMGAVWRADDTVLARQVAVKILHSALFEDDTFVQRFRREAQLVAAIDHPGIVDVHDYGESGGDGDEDRCAYIVMELIDGRPLDRVLAADGPLPPDRALAVVAAALDALHAAHQRDIVHRDLKPSNLMLRADGRVTVTDFGIARAIASTKITASHAIIGTALYMAPEQAEGEATGPSSDLYSIGVVCYELLTGRPPFVGEGVLEVALKHVRQPVPELAETFPRAVRDVVARALAKRPEDRFADAAAMAAAARAAIGAEADEPDVADVADGAAADEAAPAGGAEAGGPVASAAEAGAVVAAKAVSAGVADSRTIDLKAAADMQEPVAAKVPAQMAPAPVPAPAPAAEEAPDRPAPDEVAKVEPQPVTEAGRRRSRRTLLVPVVIPVVISLGTATVLLVDRGSGGADTAVPPAAQSTVVVTAPATPSGGSAPATPSTAPPTTPAPIDTPSATPTAGQPPAVPNQPNQPGLPVPPPGQGGNGAAAGGTGASAGRGTGTGSAAGGAAATGGSAGGGQTSGQAGAAGGGVAGGAGGAANQPGGSNPNPPQPPAQTTSTGSAAGTGSPSGGGNPPAPQAPTRPASCGGTSWTTVVSVKDGRPIGMAHDNLNGDNPIVVGGAAQYGWVRSTDPGAWTLLNACNNGGPLLVQTMDGKVTLNGGFSFLTRWTVRNGSTQGSYTLADYQNQSCMTNNGPGAEVTMVTCTPGNQAQEWRFQ
ncbi:serine/threonine-protein kinase [Kitasatospora sp. NPDC097643]|uniref:serine/threonine-protein kinase n=1 Tax=Kitasatospora sp. NPDC097643 TaxID=3157230 RepID=UPI0033215E5B